MTTNIPQSLDCGCVITLILDTEKTCGHCNICDKKKSHDDKDIYIAYLKNNILSRIPEHKTYYCKDHQDEPTENVLYYCCHILTYYKRVKS